ncbi:hypothetical protein [Burkholderia anthinoferrum]|uniref:hypothetical protein n=1 Tax=Burkholderia anthinoferrum TaxID=3090833 RepID=UPI000CE271EB|nr:hypothetical protein [Burkholderia anthinoferrum]
MRVSPGIARVVAIAVMLACAVASERFAGHCYYALVLLHSAYEAGTSSVRSWITLGYVAATYSVPKAGLTQRIGFAAVTALVTRLRALAELIFIDGSHRVFVVTHTSRFSIQQPIDSKEYLYRVAAEAGYRPRYP